MKSSTCIIAEGECRVVKLKKYLISKNLPLLVWLSEDATKITGNVQYDSKTNRFVGFVYR